MPGISGQDVRKPALAARPFIRHGTIWAQGWLQAQMMLSFYLWTLVSIGRPQDVLPELLFHLHPGKIAALFTLLLYFLNVKKKVNQNIFQTPEVVAFLFFCLVMTASGLCGVYPRQSWEFLKTDFCKQVVYCLVLSRIIVTSKDIKKLAWVIILSAVIISLASISVRAQTDRVSVGTMYDPNDLAMVLVISFPFVLYFFLEEGGFRKIFLAGAGVVILFAFLLTQSRGGFLGLMAIILTFAVSGSSLKGKAGQGKVEKGRDEGQKWSKRVVVLLLTLALVGLASNQYWQRIKTILSREDRGSMREVIWGRGLKLFAENLWLGVGVNCFSTAYGRALEKGRFGKVGNVYDRSWRAAHNSYLQVGTETGIFGLLLFLFLLGLSIKNFRETKILALAGSDSQTRRLSEMYLLGLIGFMVCGFFLSQAYSIFPYLFLAVSGILRRQFLKEVKKNEFDPEGRGLGIGESTGHSPG
ncbi:MAG: O-antigen ligase family protein [bacterium]